MNFREYLKTVKKGNGEIIVESSQNKYFNVIETIFEKKHGIIPAKLSLLELKNLLEIVRQEKYDIKGNRMYSVALKHYIKYKENKEIDNIESLKEFNDSENILISGVEGRAKLRYVTTYERNPKLREEAIRIHGCICAACGFDFNKTYGELGKGYIHIHHKVPVSELEKPKEVNPKTDLVPLCANCHSMIHRKKKSTLSVEELQKFLAR